MTAIAHSIATLERQRPEWVPWLAVVGEALHEAESTSWRGAVPEAAAMADGVPRLAGATVSMERRAVASLFQHFIEVASRSGTREMATLSHLTEAQPDVLEVFRASLCYELDRIAAIATECRAEPGALQAVAALLPVPFLQACNSVWGRSVSTEWCEPCCPVCGSWPAFAEVRGIERSRYYRCGRCGGEWHSYGLSCPYCATTDHRDLVTLVPEAPGASMSVEACRRCLGYVKTFNRLQACAPLAVMLEDLKGAALDVAALEHGYARPAGAGYPLNVVVIDDRPRRRVQA